MKNDYSKYIIQLEIEQVGFESLAQEIEQSL
jgi:hypothetical protein